MFWSIKKILIRVQQKILKIYASKMKIRETKLINEPNAIKKLPIIIKASKINNILIVTDSAIVKLGLLKTFIEELEINNIDYSIYDGVKANPTIQNVEDAYKMYKDNNCKGIVAFGGGSPIDCGKMTAVKVGHPKPILYFNKLIPNVKTIPMVFAVPTTSGTGSEVTISAVISNPDNHEKFAVNHAEIVPHYAIIDPKLLVSLPPHLTSTTGMDALTHAVESYIGTWANDVDKKNSEKTVKIIFNDLEKAYKDGLNIEVRNNMALASYYGGLAFRVAGVGYVHAIAHNLGAIYGVPHGLGNAIVLPYVLELSFKDIKEKLAKLSVVSGLSTEDESIEQAAQAFIDKIKEMKKNMNIPEKVIELKEKDLDLIAERAVKEANSLYPVPTIINKQECKKLLKKLLVT